MLEPWNDQSLLPPPVNTFLCKQKLDLKELTYTTNNIIEILSRQSPLHKEGAILSRFLYKFDKKFRNDMGYRNFKKVNTALRKYLTLNLLKDVEKFSSYLPKENDNELYLPTRQMLEYILIRIMSFSKLMLRIVVCSKQSAIFYLDRIKRGESHWMCLMPYALLCRIWSMTLVLLQHSCNWYNQLYQVIGKLEIKGLAFLPPNYKLPNDLEEWLDMKNLNSLGSFEWTCKIKINIEAIAMEDDSGDLCENILDYVSQINENIDNSDENEIKLPFIKETFHSEEVHLKQTDLGIAVSRNSLGKLDEPLGNENKAAVHTIDTVTNINSLKDFINKEENLRNESNDKALTSHLSFMQWQALKTCLLNLDTNKTKPRKIQRKFKRIWQEKCLDYK
ncbi:nucleolus and neural progenitor protein-like [Colias croceus]|uniref:nucleolus and neural progenitor protein-like n=1 Tax=Colias crocea TaxID=72248 RepID=UPI001E27A3C4|nr:nucleolus and neural progenitor protein-like [Colias croceus]